MSNPQQPGATMGIQHAPTHYIQTGIRSHTGSTKIVLLLAAVRLFLGVLITVFGIAVVILVIAIYGERWYWGGMSGIAIWVGLITSIAGGLGVGAARQTVNPKCMSIAHMIITIIAALCNSLLLIFSIVTIVMLARIQVASYQTASSHTRYQAGGHEQSRGLSDELKAWLGFEILTSLAAFVAVILNVLVTIYGRRYIGNGSGYQSVPVAMTEQPATAGVIPQHHATSTFQRQMS